ncbi:LOW QUALITY PROTEIN: 5'-nucleotidase family protein [Geomicrobium sp. JCM 19038]|nr:LOW QUALITY PROTEIN: 5'-nucleotidase family protein [Geomicrobium sp. JCM 19038]
MSKETVFFYHTNDLHSQLSQWPKIVHYLETKKVLHEDRNEDVLFFDLGDHADRVHAITEATSGQGNIELLNASPVNYVTIGNNEGITFSKDSLDHLYDQAKFDVIVANLFNENHVRPSWCVPSRIHTLQSGTTIGMLGLTAAFYPFYTELGWVIEDPIVTLERELPVLKQQCDVVVLLSHLGYFMDERIAADYDIDVILGAHTHHRLDPAIEVEGTLIAQTGKLGTDLGKITLQIDQRQVTAKEGTLQSIDAVAESSLATEAVLERLQQSADASFREGVAVLNRPLDISWTEPSTFASFLVEYLRQWCNTEISMMHSGIILASLREGAVTKGDLHRICPIPINPCIVEVKGSNIKTAIERSFTSEMVHLPLKGYGFRGVKLGIMVFAGLNVEVIEATEGEYEVLSILKDGNPLLEDKWYTIAVPDMLTFGNLYPEIVQSTSKRYMMPELIRDVLLWALMKNTES